MKPVIEFHQQVEQSEQQLIDEARNAEESSSWTIGRCASEWCKRFANGRTDADFAALIGASRQLVNVRRRVFEEFHDFAINMANLRFSHFVAALEKFKHEPEHWLEEASENKWTVREMVDAYNNHYTPANDEPDQSSAQQQLHDFFGDTSADDEEVEASGDSPESHQGNDSQSPKSDDNNRTTPPASPSIVKSEDGKEDIPEKLKPAHQTGALFQSICRKHIDPLRRALKEYREQPGAEFFDFTKVDRELQKAKDEIVSSRFWRCCPRSNCGPKCDLCDGHGYLPQKRSGYLSKEDKERLGVS